MDPERGTVLKTQLSSFPSSKKLLLKRQVRIDRLFQTKCAGLGLRVPRTEEHTGSWVRVGEQRMRTVGGARPHVRLGGQSDSVPSTSCVFLEPHGRYANELAHHGRWFFIRPRCSALREESCGLPSIRRLPGSSVREVRPGRASRAAGTGWRRWAERRPGLGFPACFGW